MSECVVRMEMPQNCYNCDLRYECNAFYAPGKPKPFMKGCMIVCQLPEGHGRLIDWDAFESIGFKLCRKTSGWRAELGTPTNESYVVPAERREI